jgi:phosphatidylcholine synthase
VRDARPLRTIAAWGVHLLTASGAPAGVLAILAAERGNAAAAMGWMAYTIAIDSIDGTLARAVGVKQVLPFFDGTRLDDIVDYFTYVIVPVLFVLRFDLLPPALAVPVALCPVLASAYGFCRTDAKTADHYFRGFPSYWNVVAFYAWALHLAPAATAVLVLGLSALVFAPLKFLYPSRAPHFRAATIWLGVVWAIGMVIAVWTAPATPPALLWATLLYPAYYFGLSFWLQATGRA